MPSARLNCARLARSNGFRKSEELPKKILKIGDIYQNKVDMGKTP